MVLLQVFQEKVEQISETTIEPDKLQISFLISIIAVVCELRDCRSTDIRSQSRGLTGHQAVS